MQFFPKGKLIFIGIKKMVKLSFKFHHVFRYTGKKVYVKNKIKIRKIVNKIKNKS